MNTIKRVLLFLLVAAMLCGACLASDAGSQDQTQGTPTQEESNPNQNGNLPDPGGTGNGADENSGDDNEGGDDPDGGYGVGSGGNGSGDIVPVLTLTFDACNGEIPDTITLDENGMVGDLLPVPVRDNYLFDGWFTAETGGELVTETTVYTNSTTIYAHWTACAYGLTLTQDSLDFGTVLEEYSAQGEKTISVTNSGNCPVTVSVSGTSSFMVSAGENMTLRPEASLTVTVTPKTGLAPGKYTENITISVGEKVSKTVAVSFVVTAKPTYTISVESTTGGRIIPVGGAAVKEGKSQAVYFYPDEGYLVQDVIVDGVSLGARQSYLFRNVRENHTVKVIFGVVNPFRDIDAHWALEEILFVYENGVMNGTGDGKFSPEETADRAMMATVLYRLAGSPAVSGTMPYSDVTDEDAWYYDAILWCARNGVYKGYDDGTFRPFEPITREQLAVIMYRFAAFRGYNVSESHSLQWYVDKTEISSWALKEIQWAVGAGIINGKPGNLIDPQGTALRCEIAAVLHRYVVKYNIL